MYDKFQGCTVEVHSATLICYQLIEQTLDYVHIT